ncbi:ribonucleotide-diphosphate reductase subunit alpha [Zobellella taiwanensis]|uniref:Ribonucleotide-diphosphate reductase subunit alpha n=1 Tax=Zobellella taiwanensis TaxID=347535 RepID=A0A2P7QMU3_9GAMM|nr:sugar ABC transporter ATP-binding protein [Zobellella taiwanensis]PSJ39265.1 ribonucleotide-diphosphate reductase subunit alpha [Zobellella taiwanensis]
MSSLLTLEHISKSFPGVKALTDISLRLDKGEIHALLGENGAGKSTLMKILCGIHRPDTGSIYINGKQMNFHNYHDAIAAGVGIIFQEFSLIPYLTATENIFLGRELTNKLGLLDRATMHMKAEALFDRLGVEIDLAASVDHLSVAEQQFVEIAKALALDARILVLDEPTATLTPSEAEHLFKIMRELKSQGVGMIFISHHMEEIYEICDRITVLRDGCGVGECEVKSTEVDDLVEMMVGRKIENNFPHKVPHADVHEVVIDARSIQLTKNAPVNSFKLQKGEILGFAGLVGSGRTELAMGLLGGISVYRKDILVNGQPKSLKSPADALNCGIGLLPESRKTEGLVLPFSIRENITLNNLAKHCGKGFIINHRDEGVVVDELMRKVRVKAPDHETPVRNLSGGNQQKVVIARWLNHECKVLIFDEPTRGIDVGAKAEIYRLMRALTGVGISIIMISSELPEIVGVSDRVAVFRQGQIVKILEGDDVNPNEIMRYATGGDRDGQLH